MVMWSLVPIRRMSLRQNLDVKTGSRSDTIDCGTPCRRTMSAKNASATDSAEYGCARGMKWQYLLKRSTTVKMTDLPRTLGNASTKSSAVCPDAVRNRQGHEQTRRVQVFGLVALADDAYFDKILHQLFHVREVEVAAESVKRPLNALVAVLVHRQHDFLDQGGSGRDVEPVLVLDHAVH